LAGEALQERERIRERHAHERVLPEQVDRLVEVVDAHHVSASSPTTAADRDEELTGLWAGVRTVRNKHTSEHCSPILLGFCHLYLE
jgi:hypothetical protein